MSSSQTEQPVEQLQAAANSGTSTALPAETTSFPISTTMSSSDIKQSEDEAQAAFDLATSTPLPAETVAVPISAIMSGSETPILLNLSDLEKMIALLAEITSVWKSMTMPSSETQKEPMKNVQATPDLTTSTELPAEVTTLPEETTAGPARPTREEWELTLKNECMRFCLDKPDVALLFDLSVSNEDPRIKLTEPVFLKFNKVMSVFDCSDGPLYCWKPHTCRFDPDELHCSTCGVFSPERWTNYCAKENLVMGYDLDEEFRRDRRPSYELFQSMKFVDDAYRKLPFTTKGIAAENTEGKEEKEYKKDSEGSKYLDDSESSEDPEASDVSDESEGESFDPSKGLKPGADKDPEYLALGMERRKRFWVILNNLDWDDNDEEFERERKRNIFRGQNEALIEWYEESTEKFRIKEVQ